MAVKLQFPAMAAEFVHVGESSLSSKETVEPSGPVPSTAYLTASSESADVIVLEIESFIDTVMLPVLG